eukprot:6202975-Karenia_brevis.AAC.1
MLHVVLVPSEHNPADSPSRGERRRKPKRPIQDKRAAMEQYVSAMSRAWASMKDAGVISSSFDTSSSSGSLA